MTKGEQQVRSAKNYGHTGNIQVAQIDDQINRD
jgi:hypothetical protein